MDLRVVMLLTLEKFGWWDLIKGRARRNVLTLCIRWNYRIWRNVCKIDIWNKKKRTTRTNDNVCNFWLVTFLRFRFRNSIEIKTCCSTKMIINNLPATRQNRCSSFGECYTWNANKSSYRRFSEADVRLNNTIEMRAMEKNFRRVWNVSKMIHRWLAARDWTREIYTCSPKFFF